MAHQAPSESISASVVTIDVAKTVDTYRASGHDMVAVPEWVRLHAREYAELFAIVGYGAEAPAEIARLVESFVRDELSRGAPPVVNVLARLLERRALLLPKDPRKAAKILLAELRKHAPAPERLEKSSAEVIAKIARVLEKHPIGSKPGPGSITPWSAALKILEAAGLTFSIRESNAVRARRAPQAKTLRCKPECNAKDGHAIGCPRRSRA